MFTQILGIHNETRVLCY